jgi:hypothetical protein
MCLVIIATNEQGLWQVGVLKLVCPNVCRYKLLMMSYLQMLGSFRPPKQKYNKIPNVQILPSAPTCHKPMLVAGIVVSLLLKLNSHRHRLPHLKHFLVDLANYQHF